VPVPVQTIMLSHGRLHISRFLPVTYYTSTDYPHQITILYT
jgi:hypothetical protein